MSKTFVGIGFGPIQSGLFLMEAHLSGNFSRLVVAEIDAAMVQAVRAAGQYTINVADPDRIRPVTVPNIEIYNPREKQDRAKLVSAIASADELATALPSVTFFDTGAPSDAAAILAEGFAQRNKSHRAIVYAAENHNHAAEILSEAVRRVRVLAHDQNDTHNHVQYLNTVIGKMSGAISDEPTISKLKLSPLVAGLDRAILVEEFNRILISRITLPNFRRGIEVFIEKDDLIPFEEAKLYGHNAIHALIGYLAEIKGYETMAEAGRDAELMAIARAAFIEESGAGLIAKWKHLGDPLFTPAGYREYAEDLLERMICPNLNDLVARVVRDPARKLAWDDRFFGTMRIALNQGIEPKHLAMGAAAAVIHLAKTSGGLEEVTRDPATAVARHLRAIWKSSADAHADELMRLVSAACSELVR